MINQENLQKLIEYLNTMQIGLVAINGYENKLGEVSSRRVNIGYSYENAKKDDIRTLNEGVEFIPSVDNKYTKGDWDVALAELKESLINPNQARSNAQKNAYIFLTSNGAVKFCDNTKEIYIAGLELDGSKKLVEGTKTDKVVKSAPKTIAKNVIRREYLKSGLIRTFTIHRLSEVALRGDRLEIKDYE
jgi:DNA-directed RNA polymerase subunit K/omega